jgi:3-oxoadipate enol-lactonase
MQIASNGSTFHCRIDGGRGPWVMLAHGLATDLTMWDELVAALKGSYRVLRYDARGHGGSPATEGDYSLDMLVADAVGILDLLGIAQCHFGGLSMGGMVTLGMLLDHPARITSAVIADSAAASRRWWRQPCAAGRARASPNAIRRRSRAWRR